jgi:hypothetical protein
MNSTLIKQPKEQLVVCILTNRCDSCIPQLLHSSTRSFLCAKTWKIRRDNLAGNPSDEGQIYEVILTGRLCNGVYVDFQLQTGHSYRVALLLMITRLLILAEKFRTFLQCTKCAACFFVIFVS